MSWPKLMKFYMLSNQIVSLIVTQGQDHSLLKVKRLTLKLFQGHLFVILNIKHH